MSKRLDPNLAHLPSELLTNIIGRLECRDLFNIALVSRAFYLLTLDSQLWRDLCRLRFGDEIVRAEADRLTKAAQRTEEEINAAVPGEEQSNSRSPVVEGRKATFAVTEDDGGSQNGNGDVQAKGGSENPWKELWKRMSTLEVSAVDKNDVTIIWMGNNWWCTSPDETSKYKQVAVLRSVWWYDVHAIIRHVPPGTYNLLVRMCVKEHYGLRNIPITCKVLEKDEGDIGTTISEHSHTLTKEDYDVMKHHGWVIYKLPYQIVIGDDNGKDQYGCYSYYDVDVSSQNHDTTSEKRGLMLDFYRLQSHNASRPECNEKEFVSYSLPSGGGFYVPRPRQHPNQNTTDLHFHDYYDESDASSENDEFNPPETGHRNNDSEGNGYGFGLLRSVLYSFWQ